MLKNYSWIVYKLFAYKVLETKKLCMDSAVISARIVSF